MSYYSDQLDRDIRKLLDPEGKQRKTVQQLVRECVESRQEAWRQAERLAAKLEALRPTPRTSDATLADVSGHLDEYWTRRT